MLSVTDFSWDIRLRRQYQALVTVQIPLSLGAFPLVAGLATALGWDSQVLTIPYRALIIAMAAMTIAFSLLLRKYDYYRGMAKYPLLVFILAYTGRLLSDTVISPVPTFFEPGFYWLFFFGTGIIPMVPLMIMTDAVTMRRAMLGLLVVLAGAGVVNYFAATQTQDVLTSYVQYADMNRLGTDAVNPISLGHVGTSLALLGFFTLSRGDRLFANRALTLACCVASIGFGIVLAAMSASRGPQVALLFSVFLFLACNRRRIGAGQIALLVLFAVAGYVGLMWVEDTTSYAPLERLRGLFEQDQSVSGRQESMANAWEQFLESPFLGSGLEERISMFYPHNIVIESFMATGIVGGTAFCLLSLYCFRYALQCMSTAQGWIGMLFCQYYLGNLLSGSIFTGWYLWVSIGVILGWAEYHRRLQAQAAAVRNAEPEYPAGSRGLRHARRLHG